MARVLKYLKRKAHAKLIRNVHFISLNGVRDVHFYLPDLFLNIRMSYMVIKKYVYAYVKINRG